MGFTSLDDLISKITVSGQYLRRDGSKQTTPVHTAAGWHCMAGLAGNPVATTYPGTDLVWSSVDEFSGDGTSVFGIQNGGPVTPATKHLLNVGAVMVGAAGFPWIAKLVDLQGYYRMSGANVTGVATRTLINGENFTASSSSGLLLTYAQDWKSGTKVRFTTSGTLPVGLSLATDYYLVRVSSTTARVATSYINYIAGTVIAFTDAGSGTHTLTIQMPRYTNGVGCEAFFVSQTLPTAGGPVLGASDYTNVDLISGRSFQGTPTMQPTAGAYATRILHSGILAGNFGPFLAKAGGDRGIDRVNSFLWNAGTAYTGAGVVALCIARPILSLDMCIPTTGMWSERDLVNQLPSMPQIMDGACLQWLLFGTGATTTLSPFNFSLDMAWA